MKKERLFYEVPEAEFLTLRVESNFLNTQIDSGSGNDEDDDY